MNAHTTNIAGSLTSGASVIPFMQEEPFEMKSNIARDLKSRASDFKTKAAALYEYVVNGYEGYQLDQTPVIEVTTKGGKIVVKDNGVGMSFEKLKRFWTMHGNTVRRENGRNKRGYHGSGKAAFYMFADKLEVRSVCDGLVNVMTLEREEIESAAEAERAPRITLVSEQVVDRPVRGVEHHFSSIDGNFTATIFHNDAGHANEDDRVFFMVDGVYIAAMQCGKEGHRFSHQVSALVNTTKAWAVENFEHRREHFMSEARDLTLKTSDPAAKELHDFAADVVKKFMDKLDAEDRERKKEKASAEEQRLFQTMSRVFSAHLLFGGKAPRPVVVNPDPQPQPQPVERTKRKQSGKGSSNDNRKPKITFEPKHITMTEAPYQIMGTQELTVYLNTNSKIHKSLAQDDRDHVRNAVLWDIAAQAVCEIIVDQWYKDTEEKVGPVSVAEAIKHQAETWAVIKNSLSDIYAEYLDQSPVAI